LQLTIGNVIRAIPEAHIVTVLPEAWIEEWKSLCLKHSFEYPQTLVAGGLTRFHSVKNALAKVPDGAIVLIHDGVRPFVSSHLLQEMLAKMEHCRALVPVTPVTDTLKSLQASENGLMEALGEDPDRSHIFGAQTPQIFFSEDIRAAYDQAYHVRFTDDASVARNYGIPVYYIQGERFNIKLTTPADLELAEFICGRKLTCDV